MGTVSFAILNINNPIRYFTNATKYLFHIHHITNEVNSVNIFHLLKTFETVNDTIVLARLSYHEKLILGWFYF